MMSIRKVLAVGCALAIAGFVATTPADAAPRRVIFARNVVYRNAAQPQAYVTTSRPITTTVANPTVTNPHQVHLSHAQPHGLIAIKNPWEATGKME